MRGALGSQFLCQLINLGLLGGFLRPSPTCARYRFVQRADFDSGPPFLDMGVIEPFPAHDRAFGSVRCPAIFLDNLTLERVTKGSACLPIAPRTLVRSPSVLVGSPNPGRLIPADVSMVKA